MAEYFISREQAENDLLSAAAYIAERIKSSDGRAEAMSAILPLYLEKGDVDLAAELANSVGDPFSRDKLLTVVAEKCAEIDDDEYALQLAEAIEDHGLQAQATERIALVKAAKGSNKKAAKIAETMAHPDFVYAGIAVNQAAGGDEVAARATLEQIDFASARVSAIQHIAASLIEGGESGRAVEWLDAAIESANDIEHNEEKIRTLCDIGNLFIEAKRNDKAVAAFDAARGFSEQLDNVHRDLFLGSCALGFLHAGSTEFADRTLDLVTDKTQMASALVGFAREYWRKEDKDDAIDTIEEAYAVLKSQRETETRDSRTRNGLLTTIAAQFAGFGKTERSIEIAQTIPDEAEQMSALSQIARILTVQNEDDLARQAFNSINDDASRLFALVGMSDEKEKRGDRKSSDEMLDDALSMIDTVPQLASRSSVYNAIASRFAAHDKVERARTVLLENLQMITGIRDESTQAAALASLAELYDANNLEIGDSERQIVRDLVQRSD